MHAHLDDQSIEVTLPVGRKKIEVTANWLGTFWQNEAKLLTADGWSR